MLNHYLESEFTPKTIIVWISGKFNIIHSGHVKLFSETIKIFKDLKPRPKFYIGSKNIKYTNRQEKEVFLKKYKVDRFKVLDSGSWSGYNPSSIVSHFNLNPVETVVIYPVSSKDLASGEKKFLTKHKAYERLKSFKTFKPMTKKAYYYVIPAEETAEGSVSSSAIRKILKSKISDDKKQDKLRKMIPIVDDNSIWKILQKVQKRMINEERVIEIVNKYVEENNEKI